MVGGTEGVKCPLPINAEALNYLHQSVWAVLQIPNSSISVSSTQTTLISF